MPEPVQQPAPQPQVTTTPKSTNWKKVALTIIFIVACVSIIAGIYWFLVIQKGGSNSDLTGPVPKVTTKKATESAKEATPSAEKDGWKTYSDKTDKTFNFSISYPEGWSIVKGPASQCASLGGGSSEDNICFNSPDYVEGSTTGMGIMVENRPYFPDEHSIKCSDSPSIKECQELKIAGQDALKFLARSDQVKGMLAVDEMYSFPGKNNKSSIYLTITYFRCQEGNDKDCTKKEDADKFIDKVISSFKFLD